jgi:PIN domain nuclease of toxin-antitoxin system
VKAIVDTHVFLWAISGDSRLSKRHCELWQDESSELFLSFASVWEMLIKAGLGKLPLPTPHSSYIFKQMESNRLAYLGIRPAHFTELESLPPLHRDPFDRMLVAQARAERMPVATADPLVRRYGVKVL